MSSVTYFLVCLVIFCCNLQYQVFGDYEGCKSPNFGFLKCEINGTVEPPNEKLQYLWDVNCTRIHNNYPFGCYKQPCSPQNEAFFLGRLVTQTVLDDIYAATPTTTLAPDQTTTAKCVESRNPDVFCPPTPRPRTMTPFFFGDQFRDGGDDAWEKFVQMGWADEALEKLAFPTNNIGLSETDKRIPRICDPRAYLYCDSSFLRPGLPVQKRMLRSMCRCHPLYSIEVQSTPPRLDFAECHGRPGVPCEYDRNALYLGLEPNGLPQEQAQSNCMTGTTCEAFSSQDEKEEYQKGMIFHGFGLSPILHRYMLSQVTKICKCDPKSARSIMTVMHDCVGDVKQ